ncbi:Quercetin 2,3-dioxygenase [Rhodocyclaceae bacterium]|nr:Quercetin 2,3-dioxygenase [Rhodocyclaceae bacterium]
MLKMRPAADRGHADHGWLKTWHSFSFADSHDPAEMGWGPLRVINDDIIAPDTGFGRHGHRDMEIVTYLLSGQLAHGDSMENAVTLRRPEVQRMSAGRGVMHSEFNPSADEAAHLLQIWIEPAVRGIAPEYEQRAFADADKRGRWLPIATPDGRAGSFRIRQDASLYATLLAAGETVEHDLAPGRRAYVHVATGDVALNGLALSTGDGVKIADETILSLAATGAAEVLLFDLP